MIKFFRKIRYDLMEKNKPGKYLKYAIGEIMLVVIGILIALSINNWNEQRKNSANERDLYQRIIKDLKVDAIKLNEKIKYYKNDQFMHNRIYQQAHGIADIDSLTDLTTIRSAQPFDLIIEANYSDFTNEIKNDEVRERINQYFRLEGFVHDASEQLWGFKEEQLKPYLSKYGINDAAELFSNYQLDYFELRKKNIFSHAMLKQQYGTLELDQMLFNLGIKTSWALTALEDILAANKNLQLELNNKLGKKRQITKAQ